MTRLPARRAARLLTAWAALLGAAACHAHDTWFQTYGTPSPAGQLLRLGTGNRFPVHESAVGAEHLAQRGCSGAPGVVPLEAVALQRRALLLRVGPSEGSVSCWAELVPFEVELDEALAAAYLDEIHADPGLRAHWAELQARGVRWRERYRKHARVELGPAAAAPRAAASPLGLDLRPEPVEGPWRAGERRTVRVLEGGQPLAGQWVELVDAKGASAGWQRSDDQGRLQVQPGAAGPWLLRGTQLRWRAAEGRWDSRFVTLSIAVGPAADAQARRDDAGRP